MVTLGFIGFICISIESSSTMPGHTLDEDVLSMLLIAKVSLRKLIKWQNLLSSMRKYRDFISNPNIKLNLEQKYGETLLRTVLSL